MFVMFCLLSVWFLWRVWWPKQLDAWKVGGANRNSNIGITLKTEAQMEQFDREFMSNNPKYLGLSVNCQFYVRSLFAFLMEDGEKIEDLPLPESVGSFFNLSDARDKSEAEAGSAMSVRIGQGNFGTVYKEKVGGTVYAVKKIKRYHRKAEKEVEMMSKLDCPYIIKLIGHCFEGTTLCIQMEFADQGTFEDFMTREAKDPGAIIFDEWCIWRGLSHIAMALKYLHGMRPQPILHRDLKPDNILGVSVMKNGWKVVAWKLADFGIAKLLTENDQGEFYTCQASMKHHYMAPEVVADHRRYTISADVWALGSLILYYCNRTERLMPPGILRGGYSEDLTSLIRGMLHPTPNCRPTAAAVWAECSNARQEFGQH